MTSTTHTERLGIAPFQAPVFSGELEVLDAELVAIDGVPVADVAEVPSQALYGPQPEWFEPRQSLFDDPFWILTVLKWCLPAGILSLVLYGVAHMINVATSAVAEHAQGIGQAGAGIGIGWLLLLVLGGGGAACAGLHCGGCRR